MADSGAACRDSLVEFVYRRVLACRAALSANGCGVSFGIFILHGINCVLLSAERPLVACVAALEPSMLGLLARWLPLLLGLINDYYDASRDVAALAIEILSMDCVVALLSSALDHVTLELVDLTYGSFMSDGYIPVHNRKPSAGGSWRATTPLFFLFCLPPCAIISY